jgi:hypothetical protein
MLKLFKYVVLFFLPVFINHTAVSQELTIHTKEIELLIEEWNILHNGHIPDGFKNIYAEQILFYTEQMPRTKAIRLKKKLFARKPDYRQRIHPDIQYTGYTSGIIKCQFTKDVWEKSKWKPYPSYLLVKYEQERHWIVGESDLPTDHNLSYKLELGKEAELKILPEKIASIKKDSVKESAMTGKNPYTMLLRSKEMITVPKRYIFFLIILLISGGLLIFLSESVRVRKKKRKSKIEKKVDAKTRVNQEIQKKVMIEPFVLIENQLKQSAFKTFVLSLLDPVYFTYIKARENVITPGNPMENDIEPLLEFQLKNNQAGPKTFAIQTLYREDTGETDVELFSERRLRFNNQFEREIDLYYVVGVGGPPEHPNDLYLLPSQQVKTMFLSKETLRPFRKTGRFTFNNSGILQ